MQSAIGVHKKTQGVVFRSAWAQADGTSVLKNDTCTHFVVKEICKSATLGTPSATQIKF